MIESYQPFPQKKSGVLDFPDLENLRKALISLAWA
jgi:hypothetical protein